ncbi:MAG: hypothetical protein JST92_03265 [Deltaproteobacteria bacterium]|nr:hypothetical protein [Deltaproteobacteria bacterium]
MRIKTVLAPAALGVLLATSACTGTRAPRSDGERLYLSRCTSCHAAYEPRDYTANEWDHAVAKMIDLKKVELSEGDRALILSYLLGTEQAGTRVASAPMRVGAGGP